MGQKYTLPHLWKEDEPYAFDPIQYDPQFGFEERKQRVPKATVQEMNSANLDPLSRDFCAHKTILYRGCISDNAPFWYKCKGLEHEVRDCYTEERIHDMKEFEREKRLNIRERRLRKEAGA